MYTPSAVSILGWICALYKSYHLIYHFDLGYGEIYFVRVVK
jgi:hypothetical protein